MHAHSRGTAGNKQADISQAGQATKRAVARPVTGPTSALSILDLQAMAGNAAVVQMMNRAGQIQEQRHRHGTGCGHLPGGQPAVVQRSGGDGVVQRADAGSGQATPSAGPPDTSIRDVILNMVTELHLEDPRVLEMELFDPRAIVMSIGFDPEYAELSVPDALKKYTPELVGVCGETANQLRQITFARETQSSKVTLDGVIAQVQQAGDANMQIHGNTHAFFVEKRGGSCRILQSYQGKYSLSDSLEGRPEAGATSVSAADFARGLQEIGAHHLNNVAQNLPWQTHPAEDRLFGGPMLSERDISNGVVEINFAVTGDIADPAEQGQRLAAVQQLHAPAWQSAKKFDGTAGDLAMSYLA
ncbi:hypothetical protein ACFVQ0_31315 [Streptomyces sp. NPDC057900]|uniref:hypothetical protein n=1 Tax=Streptomyces sp. NPDC057900 TaxID=3346274 RepID=UPI0036E20648